MIVINGDKVLPNVLLSTTQLINAARDIGYNIEIFMRDMIPKLDTGKHGYYIINTNRLGGNGTHLVCLVTKVPIDKHRTGTFFFNSFGTRPMSQIMAAIGDDIYYSTWQQQGEDQTNCGHFCLIFLYRLSRGWDAFRAIEGLHIGANHDGEGVRSLPEMVIEHQVLSA